MNRRADAAREKADLIFHVYYQQGPDRSLKRLHSDLKTMGVRTSLATLKRYSKEYGWQEHIRNQDTEARQQQNQRGVEDVLDMNERHTQVARALQGAGVSALQRLLADDSRLGNLKASDITRLVDLGIKAERKAVGASSDRREIALETWNDVVTSVVKLFTEINEEPDPDSRAARFALRIDRLVDERLAEVAKKGD